MKLSTVSVGSADYDLAVHPSNNSKSPIFVHVNQQGNTALGAYVYTIGKPDRTPNSSGSIRNPKLATYSSVIQGDGGGLQDLATNLGRVLVKKFGCPTYVSISGGVSLTDYGLLSREVVEACETVNA